MPMGITATEHAVQSSTDRLPVLSDRFATLGRVAGYGRECETM